METTFTFIKKNYALAILLLALLYLKADMDRGFSEARLERTELRSEMTANNQSIRAEMTANIQSVRAEMTDMRSEMHGGFTAVRSDIADLGERMARVESKIEGIDGRLYRVEGLLDELRPLEGNQARDP